MSHPAPPRLNRLSPLSFAITVAALAVLVASMTQGAPSPGQLVQGGPSFLNLMDRMTPPNLDPAFLWRIGARIVETFQITLVGAAFGVLLSIPIGWLAARGVSPLGRFHVVAKALVSLFRTIPDLVWALIFVATVGLTEPDPFKGQFPSDGFRIELITQRKTPAIAPKTPQVNPFATANFTVWPNVTPSKARLTRM